MVFGETFCFMLPYLDILCLIYPLLVYYGVQFCVLWVVYVFLVIFFYFYYSGLFAVLVSLFSKMREREKKGKEVGGWWVRRKEELEEGKP